MAYFVMFFQVGLHTRGFCSL